MRRATIFYNDKLAGILTESDDGYTFLYSEDYLKKENPQPISLTLPLSEKVYHSNVLFPFFDGLIPEGWLLNIGEKYWKLNPNDRFELLINLCNDAVGAVSVFPMEAENHE